MAPDVAQLSELMPPKVIPVGFAVKELMEGRFGSVTVTIVVAVADPAVLVAVSV